MGSLAPPLNRVPGRFPLGRGVLDQFTSLADKALLDASLQVVIKVEALAAKQSLHRDVKPKDVIHSHVKLQALVYRRTSTLYWLRLRRERFAGCALSAIRSIRLCPVAQVEPLHNVYLVCEKRADASIWQCPRATVDSH